MIQTRDSTAERERPSLVSALINAHNGAASLAKITGLAYLKVVCRAFSAASDGLCTMEVEAHAGDFGQRLRLERIRVCGEHASTHFSILKSH